MRISDWSSDVCSSDLKALFGSCRWLTDTLLPKFGIETTTVDATDNAAWEAAIRPNTKVFFFETPANPTMDVADLATICGIAKAHGIVSVVANAFATPALQRPMEFGAAVRSEDRRVRKEWASRGRTWVC